MKMCPKNIAMLVSGISLLLATSAAQAGNSFFSFSIGYSSHGHYVSPYRYVYAPAYIYTVPSPFFFGYTSYYYPVFPYYYTPVVYYRPILPYRYPYAYYPYKFPHRHYYAYRGIYPSTYFHGYYAHNRYYNYKPYYHYNYSHGHHAQYKYQPRKKQYTGLNTTNLVVNSPSANALVRQAPATQNIQSVTINNTARERQRVRELERYRSTLQRRHPNQSVERRNDSRPGWNERRTFANTDTRSLMQQRRNDQVRARFNNRNPRIDQSGQTNQTVNNRRIERLINRDRGTSRPDLERNNRLNQQRPIVNQQNQRRTRANLVNTREANSPVQNRQINQLRPPRNNLVRPDNNSFRQQPAAAERNRQSNQGQITQQRPARNNLERPANVNSQQQPAAAERNRQSSQGQITQQRPARNNQGRPANVNSQQQLAAAERNRQSSQGQITQQRPARNNQERSAIVNSPRQPAATRNISQGNQRSESIAQRRESAGKMNTRSGNHMSLRQGGISQKSAGGLGLNAE